MEDRAVAQAVNGIDIIIGGHSHTAMVKPDIINNTLLYQAGSKSQYVGRIKLELDEKTGKINKHFFKLIEVKESVHGRNLAMKRLVDRISAPIMEPLLKPVGHTDKTLVKVSGPVSTDEKIAEVKETKATSPWGIELLQLPGNKWFITETNLSQIVCDSFAEAAGVPIAFTNLAGIRAGMLPGPIDRLMVYKTLPFQNYIWVLSMKGKDITELFNMGKDLYSGPFLQSCGLEIRYKVTGDSIALSSISHQGKILDPEASYDVCTNNFLAAGGDGFAAFTKAKLVKKTDILLRDAFEKYIKSRKVIAPVITPRILFER
jgi:2',3'-cyclic-nucleotide 2'-phosphodiesterase (5'-nucleotidase family)